MYRPQLALAIKRYPTKLLEHRFQVKLKRMADDFKKRSDLERRRRREDEAEEDFVVGTKKKVEALRGNGAEFFSVPQGASTPAKLKELIELAEPMIEQVNTLYQQYLGGAEKLPPNQRRRQLDQLMAAIHASGKPTLAIKFLANGIRQRYLTYADKWDRLLRDLEDGKIQRQAKRR